MEAVSDEDLTQFDLGPEEALYEAAGPGAPVQPIRNLIPRTPPDDPARLAAADILKAFGLKPWDITSAVRPPLRVRLWRAVTFARRRGKVIDWSSYEAAETEARAAEAEYLSALPGRMQEIADRLSEGLPGGMRFEWAQDQEAIQDD